MKCIICKNGQTYQGSMTATLERDNTTLVIKKVPADICENCGEQYLNQQTAKELLEYAENAVKEGIQVDIRTYKKAA